MTVPSDRITVAGFSSTFEQMCNFVAVAKTGDPNATVAGLVALCLTLLKDDRFTEPQHLATAIEELFSIRVPATEVERALSSLESSEQLGRDNAGRYVLAAPARTDIQSRIDKATGLESRVRDQWQSALAARYPKLDGDTAWKALRAYLFRAFRRHGVQTAALLDPAVHSDPSYEASLASLLKEAVAVHFPTEQQELAEEAVAGFLADVDDDPERTTYVIQLADAAFSFYTLEIDPTIASSLRKRLPGLTLFLDTNFLFGILDLHHNTQSSVSHDLLRAIDEHNLPFKLRYHQATADEMRRTIAYFASVLKSRRWTQSLSRAASRTRQLTGIEQTFHERNADQPIDVDEFLRPIQHFDNTLRQKKIDVYRPTTDRLDERVQLYHEYKQFLEENGRPEKIYETVQHDATMLDATRLLRTKVKSSLEAGALLITCDYMLYRFDRETCRKTSQQPSVMLPNVFWQLLRPFIATDVDFDRSFAETFALPEFRTISSGGAKACSKMLAILATYKDMPEETAYNLLSDGMLVDRLQTVTTDKEFAELVESAIIDENRELLEETAALRQERDQKAKALQQVSKQREAEKIALETRHQELLDSQQAADKRAQAASAIAREREQQASEARRLVEDERKARETAELVARQAETGKATAEKRAFRMSVAAGVVFGALLVIVWELLVNWIPWEWLINHSNSIPIQIGTSCLLFSVALGIGVREWRKWCFCTAGLALLCVLIPLFN